MTLFGFDFRHTNVLKLKNSNLRMADPSRFRPKIDLNYIILSIPNAIVFTWMSQDCSDNKSTLTQVMAWYHVGAIRSLLLYGITMPQWVNTKSLTCVPGHYPVYVHSLAQDCIISIANSLQSCTEISVYVYIKSLVNYSSSKSNICGFRWSF